ncbi:MAG: transcription antitermination factor NusB [Thalassobaculum sp.]|uniref:transcription antitermination factor NusB n=1 Tax=Thalassobaculum sp. TaxID=2022740 RepID=UPI0032EB9C07
MNTTDQPAPKPRKVPKQARSAPRTTARLAAAQALYEMEIAGKSGHEVVPEFVASRFAGLIEGGDMAPADPRFFERLVLGVAGEMPTLDRMLTDCLQPEGHLERLEIVLRAIMRLGAYELLAVAEVPARVAISEYVDLAHAFFAGREPALVNGVLDRIAHVVRSEELAGPGRGGAS